MFSNYCGMRIVESVWCTVPEEHVVSRPWRERLFSWPWKPWVAEKMVVVQVPDKQVYVMGHSIICHPVVAKQIRAEFPT